MSPSKFDYARTNIQDAAREYERVSTTSDLSAFADGKPASPPNPNELLKELSKAMVMVINHLDDVSK